MAAQRKKKVVRVEPTPEAESGHPIEPTWRPTPEAKGKATTYRIIAGVLWLLAIGGEAFAIFWVLKQTPVVMWLLITLIVVIGILAIGGSLLWKQANRLDPASKQDTVRFFVQNQLGAIITVIAFLPLIILVFLNKDMSGAQKGIAGGVAIAVCAVAVFFGLSLNPPSVEQYSQESNTIVQLTGHDVVYWTKSGTVFHVCADVPDVNKESKDGQIYEGSVADAHAAGKERLVSYWEREAVNYCGYTQEQVDAVNAGSVSTDAPEAVPSETPAAG